MINKPLPFKGLTIRILIIIPIKGSGLLVFVLLLLLLWLFYIMISTISNILVIRILLLVGDMVWGKGG